MRAIKRSLRCDLTDAEQALLACLKFQHLNAEAPERHSVIIKDGALHFHLHFHDIQKTLQAKTTQQTKDPQSAMIKLPTEAEHAVMQFHAMLAGAVLFTVQNSH